MSIQQTQNSFPGPKSYRDFRETGPRVYNVEGSDASSSQDLTRPLKHIC